VGQRADQGVWGRFDEGGGIFFEETVATIYIIATLIFHLPTIYWGTKHDPLVVIEICAM
jgi:hypothetical protein